MFYDKVVPIFLSPIYFLSIFLNRKYLFSLTKQNKNPDNICTISPSMICVYTVEMVKQIMFFSDTLGLSSEHLKQLDLQRY